MKSAVSLIILFTFLAVGVLAQSQSPYPPSKVDISKSFEQIDDYNTNIRNANYYHHQASKKRFLHSIRIILGIPATIVGGISLKRLIEEDYKGEGTGVLLLAILGIGGGAGSVVGGIVDLNNVYSTKSKEYEYLNRAKEIFPNR